MLSSSLNWTKRKTGTDMKKLIVVLCAAAALVGCKNQGGTGYGTDQERGSSRDRSSGWNNSITNTNSSSITPSTPSTPSGGTGAGSSGSSGSSSDNSQNKL